MRATGEPYGRGTCKSDYGRAGETCGAAPGLSHRHRRDREKKDEKKPHKLIAIQSAIDALDKAYQDEKADMVG